MRNDDTRASDWIHPGTTAGTTSNAALTTSANKAPTLTKPETSESAGRFVVDVRTVAPPRPEGNFDRAVHYELAFLAQDANNETFAFRVWQWTNAAGTWLPRLLIAGTGAAGARVGVADGNPDETWFLADTIATTVDNTVGASVEIDADSDGLARMKFDGDGSGLLEIECTRNSSSAAVRPMIRAL